MVLGVQNLVGDSHASEKCGDEFRFLDGDSTYKNRLACLMHTLDLLADGGVLELLVQENKVIHVLSDDGKVGGDDHNIKVVDLAELGGLGIGCSGHSGELVVHSEEVLECDGGQCLVLSQDLNVLFRLDGLVQAVRIASSVKYTSGELIDDLDLVVLDHVVRVLVVQVFCHHGLCDIVDVFEILVVIEGSGDDVELLQKLLHVDHSFLGEAYVSGFLVKHEVSVRFELGSLLESCEGGDNRVLAGLGVLLAFLEVGCDLLGVAGKLCVVVSGTGDDQGSAGLIDEDGVDLVYDAEVVLGLDLVLCTELHVVTQVVESELVVGSVCHIALVGEAASFVVHVGDDGSDCQTQEVVDWTHP